MSDAPLSHSRRIGVVSIPAHELEIHAITGGGPGGQHVNRSATRVVVRWNVDTSQTLSDAQRARLRERLASKLDSAGWLRIVAGEFRSQLQNRVAAIERLDTLVRRALMVPPVRHATRPTRGSVERRLTDKKRRQATKQQRRVRGDD